jgi:hypothetical protein
VVFFTSRSAWDANFLVIRFLGLNLQSHRWKPILRLLDLTECSVLAGSFGSLLLF